MVGTRWALGAGGALGALLLVAAGGADLPPVAWGTALLTWSLVGGWVATVGPPRLGPADLVTLARAVLAAVVAGLVAVDWGTAPSPALLVVATVALASDAVDGRLARRTGTGSAFGARFDGEADALLMLVLSAPAAHGHGWWVLSLGLVRYAFGAAGAVQPWLAVPLPARPWRKVVTATAGTCLLVAASGLLPREAGTAGLLLAAALLAESFGRDVVWAWRHRAAVTPDALAAAP